MSKRTKAILITTLLGIVLFLGIFLVWRFDAPRVNASEDLTSDFYLVDSNNLPMTKYDLTGQVTVLLLDPNGCSMNQSQPNQECQDQVQNREALTKFIEERLFYHTEDEKTPMRLAAFIGVPGWDLPAPWRTFHITNNNVPEFAQKYWDDQKSTLLVINQNPTIIYVTQDFSNLDPEMIQPLLSKIVMNHYITDYISKRTFFRREPKKEVPSN